MKILAVDDDVLLLELLKTTLENAGFEDVTTAPGSEEGLALVEQATSPYECVLLDIQMPVMDGIELCTRLRAMDEYKNTPILMITAMTERSFVERAFTAGANDYVSKPFDPFELVTRLRLANESVRKNRVVADKVFALNSLRSSIEEQARFGPDEAVAIEDVPGCVDHLVLENYVLQLSRSESFQTAVMGIRMAEFEEIYKQSTPSELILTLTDVAEAIAAVLKTSHYLMSYSGGGIFTCVTRRDSPCLGEDFAEQLADAVKALDLVYDDGTPCPVTLLPGGVQERGRLFGGTGGDLIREAIAAAKMAGAEKPARKAAAKVRVFGGWAAE